MDRLEKAGLIALWAFIGAALLGFATFGVHPELVGRVPGAARWYGPAFRGFAVGQVWIAFALFALVLVRRVGIRWLIPFVALYLISLTSELAGTTWGIPFGSYAYSDLLSPKWFSRVPAVIPLSWFYMGVASFAILPRLLRTGAVGRVIGAAACLTIWDLALDPAMSFLTPYWTWSSTGPYYGMPWVNLLGWFVTAIALMAALTALRADRWIEEIPTRWFGHFYLANLMLPIGMNLAASLWLATAVGAVVLTGGLYLWNRTPVQDRSGSRESFAGPPAPEAVR